MQALRAKSPLPAVCFVSTMMVWSDCLLLNRMSFLCTPWGYFVLECHGLRAKPVNFSICAGEGSRFCQPYNDRFDGLMAELHGGPSGDPKLAVHRSPGETQLHTRPATVLTIAFSRSFSSELIPLRAPLLGHSQL